MDRCNAYAASVSDWCVVLFSACKEKGKMGVMDCQRELLGNAVNSTDQV